MRETIEIRRVSPDAVDELEEVVAVLNRIAILLERILVELRSAR